MLLRRRGINNSIADSAGKTPLDYAKELGDDLIMRHLYNQGAYDSETPFYSYEEDVNDDAFYDKKSSNA